MSGDESETVHMEPLKPVGNLSITEQVVIDHSEVMKNIAQAAESNPLGFLEFDDNKDPRMVERRRREAASVPQQNAPWQGAISWDFGVSEKWGAGPWSGEPDKVLWRDEATGMHCIARRGRMGAWCGYVAVEAGHSWHGMHYDMVHEAAPDLDVHGGLTFSESCPEDDTPGAICHPSDDGQPAWWLGFDCCHSGDFTYFFKLEELAEKTNSDFERKMVRRLCGDSREELMAEANKTYKTLSWVRLEIEDLAKQVRAAG